MGLGAGAWSEKGRGATLRTATLTSPPMGHFKSSPELLLIIATIIYQRFIMCWTVFKVMGVYELRVFILFPTCIPRLSARPITEPVSFPGCRFFVGSTSPLHIFV